MRFSQFFWTISVETLILGYYNEARILDQVTFANLKQLPNMPAAVDKCVCVSVVFVYRFADVHSS